jgi:hypothetical protein
MNEDLHHKLHGGIVIVEQDHLVHRWFFDLLIGLRTDTFLYIWIILAH